MANIPSGIFHTFAAILGKELLYRQITAFIFLAALIAQTFNKSFLIADYYTNIAKYAKKCENKTKPQLKCNGKCQMMKKLKQEEKKDEENPERKPENKNETLISSKSFFPSLPSVLLPENIIQKIRPVSSGKSIDRSCDVFHPPQA
jgi:hypothetical protein